MAEVFRVSRERSTLDEKDRKIFVSSTSDSTLLNWTAFGRSFIYRLNEVGLKIALVACHMLL